MDNALSMILDAQRGISPFTAGDHGTAAGPSPLYAGYVTHDGDRPAKVDDVHELAQAMPHVTVEYGNAENAVFQVGDKSFVFFRTPRPDAFDPETGERYSDIIVIWVPSEADKQALIQDETTPFFTTPHFNGHKSVLVRASRLGEVTRGELAEIIQDAWLCRASRRRAKEWLDTHRPT